MISGLRKKIFHGTDKPQPGVTLILGHPLARDMIVCCPFLEHSGLTSTNLADGRILEVIEGTHPGPTNTFWVSTPYGIGMDFTPFHNIALIGDDEGYAARQRNGRPAFLGEPLTFIFLGKIGAPAFWKGAIDLASGDKNASNQYSRVYCGCAFNTNNMWCQITTATAVNSSIAPVSGDWETLVYRCVPTKFIDFMRFPKKGGMQRQRVAAATPYETATRNEFKIGNQFDATSSWRSVIVYMYVWSRYLSDDEIKSIVAAPYQIFR